MPNFSGDEALIEKTIKDLHAAWAATADGWRDQARPDFEREHLDEIEARLREAGRAMLQIQTILREAVTACS
jgi:hypothetical protein